MKEILEIISNVRLSDQEVVSEIESLYEAKLKEELIKFKRWFNFNFPAPTDIVETKDIDDYLKQRNNG